MNLALLDAKYLTNKKILHKSCTASSATSDKDKKFYKKRLINLFKKLLDDVYSVEYFSEIESFDCFVKNAIQHLRMMDYTDSYQSKLKVYAVDQEEYEEEEEEEKEVVSEDIIKNINTNLYMKKSLSCNNNTLDRFVTVSKSESIHPNPITEILPVIIEPNLECSKLMHKGCKRSKRLSKILLVCVKNPKVKICKKSHSKI